jgi:hypothetical protein
VQRPYIVLLIVSFITFATGLALAPIKERSRYIETADNTALLWMRDNLRPNSYVLVNTFYFPWSPSQKLGTDSGLWIPLVAGARSSVPPINAYNEKPAGRDYFDTVQALASINPPANDPTGWQVLKQQGITHIFIGSLGAGNGFSVPALLNDPNLELIFHQDAVWLFKIL